MLIVQLLGRFTVLVDGEVIDLPLRSAQTLLAYLILTVGKAHRREQLAGLLWPDTDDASAKGNLRHTLWRLRKALGPRDGLMVDDLTIGFDPQADYRLDAQALSVRPAPDANVDAMLKVVAAYEGELLPGFYDDWIVLERERLRTSYEAWMAQLLDKLQAEQRWAEVLEWGERWIAFGHTPEAAYRALIAAHAQRGDSAAAALTYRRCVDALRADLGVDPSPQTRATYDRWLQNELNASGVDPLPRLLRGYLLEQRLDSGPHGVVYSAVQTGVGRRVAVKVITPELANRPGFIRQFEANARLVAQLEHPHIVPLLDYWRDPTGAYLVTRWMPHSVQGQMSEGRVAPSVVTRIVDQLASALAVAQRYGIAHLNVRPTNILLDEKGDAFLTDFGVACSAADKRPIIGGHGNAGQSYDSPEVRESALGSPLSDVYSLGMVATELLQGGSVESRDGPDLSPSRLPAAVVRVLKHATARDPAARFSSAPAFAAALQLALRQEVEPLEPAGSGELANPFKGLRAFEEIDVGDFFGREALVQNLIQRLSDGGPLARFLAVVGPSGCGKSSVVKAGLIPALRDGAIAGSESWYIVTLTPGDHPLRSLEASLVSIATHPLAFLWDQLQTDVRGLVWAADSVLAGVEGRLLLVVDQLEELFTLTESEVERSRFLRLIASAVNEPRSRVHVVATLRADFTDRPLHYAEFGELMRQRTEMVVPLTADELSRAVTGPAQRVGVAVDSDLLAAIVTDVSEEPGALPLLQYALTETFDHRDERRLTLRAYHETGGAFGALTCRADEVFDSLDPIDQAIARQVFLRLVTLGEGVDDTRRRVLRDELEGLNVPTGDTVDASAVAIIGRVLDSFGRTRLLAFDRDPTTRRPTVEVSHEALLREWPRLRGWLNEGRGEVRLQRQLAQAAAEWRASQQDPSFLLTGARLAQFEGWLTSATLTLTQEEQALVTESLADRDRRAQAEAARRARETKLEHRARRVLQALVGVFLVAAVVAGGLAWWANDRRVAALAAEQQAVASLDLSEAQRLAAESNRLFIEGRDFETAALLAVQSISLHDTPQGDEALSRAARQTYPTRLLEGHVGEVRQIAFSADGKLMVSGDGAGHPMLWDVATGAILKRFEGHYGLVLVADISPDGRVAVTGGDDGTVRVWDTATGGESYRLDIGAIVWAADISRDGQDLLIGDRGGDLRIVDLTTGAERVRFSKTTDVVGAVFSPDGQMVLSGHADGTLRLWDVRTGAARLEIPIGDWPWALDFAPDMSTFAVGTWAKQAYIIDTRTGKIRHTLPHTDELFTSLAYSPDGQVIFTGDARGVAHLWDVRTGLESRRFVHSTSVSGGAFTPDGRFLVTGTYEKVIRFWPLDARPIQGEVYGAGTSEGKLAFVDQGSRIFTQGQLFDSISGEPVLDTGSRGFADVSANETSAYVFDLNGFVLDVFDATTWDRRYSRKVECPANPYGVGISQDGAWVVLADFGKPYDICLLDTHSGAVVSKITTVAPVWDLAFSSDGRTLAAGACDSTTRLFDVATGAETRVMRLTDTLHCVNSVAFSPDDSMVLSSGVDGRLALWDVRTGALVREFVGHTGVVWGVAFSSDGRVIGSAGADGTARLWDVGSGRELRRLTGHTATVWDIAFSPDGRRVATTSSDGFVKFWWVDLDELRNALCSTLPRDLSDAERSRYAITDPGPTCAQTAEPQLGGPPKFPKAVR